SVVDEQQLRTQSSSPLEQLQRARDAARDLRHLVRAEYLQAGTAVLRKTFDLEEGVRKREDVVSSGQGSTILCRR
ncbi:MAG: hypothetical protein QOE91_918, partial [Gaiellaceae bacterium]|nr:hypothetical protein [Gaiellaceae bacterium]